MYIREHAASAIPHYAQPGLAAHDHGFTRTYQWYLISPAQPYALNQNPMGKSMLLRNLFRQSIPILKQLLYITARDHLSQPGRIFHTIQHS